MVSVGGLLDVLDVVVVVVLDASVVVGLYVVMVAVEVDIRKTDVSLSATPDVLDELKAMSCCCCRRRFSSRMRHEGMMEMLLGLTSVVTSTDAVGGGAVEVDSLVGLSGSS